MMLAVGLLLLHARPSGGPLYRGWLGRLSYLGVLTTLGAALFTSSSPSGLVAQITTTNATNLLNGRTSVWQYAWAEFQRNQLFGYGPGLFGTAYRSLLPAQLQFAGEAHNQFMQTLGEAGLVGLAGLVGYLVLSSRAALRCRQSTRGLSLALMLSLVVRMAAEAPLQNYGVNIALFSHLAVLAVLLYGREAEAAPAEKSSSPRHQPQRVLVAA
jgi:O-antigen ligase